MDKKEIAEGMDTIRAKQAMNFQNRLAVEQVFLMYCNRKTYAVTIPNFLVWLSKTKDGHAVIKALMKHNNIEGEKK